MARVKLIKTGGNKPHKNPKLVPGRLIRIMINAPIYSYFVGDVYLVISQPNGDTVEIVSLETGKRFDPEGIVLNKVIVRELAEDETIELTND